MSPTLAFSPETEARLTAIIIPIVALAIIIAAIYFILKSHRQALSDSTFEALLEKAINRAGPINKNDPQVSIEFHTYSGVLVTFIQTRHAATYPAPIARAYLKELRNYNLKRCLIPYKGSLYVPILTLLEYRSQCKKIDGQIQGAIWNAPH